MNKTTSFRVLKTETVASFPFHYFFFEKAKTICQKLLFWASRPRAGGMKIIGLLDLMLPAQQVESEFFNFISRQFSCL